MNELIEPWLEPWQVRKVVQECEPEQITLTYQLLHSAGTEGIGFNYHQLKLLGVPWPPKRGWLTRLIGTQVDSRTWETVLRLRGVRKRAERKVILGQHQNRLL